MSSRVVKPAEVGSVTWRSVTVKKSSRAQSPPPPPTSSAEQHARAESLWREAEQKMIDLQQQVEAAFHRGVAEGENRLRAAQQQEIAELRERFSRSLAALGSLRSRLRKEAESDLVKLSIEIARRILHRQMTVDPGALEALVSTAVQRLNGLDCLRVRVSPAHAAATRLALARIGKAEQLEVVEDASLSPGDFQYDTARGSLDASIEVQLKEIERGFCDRLSL